jgi:hypothetical protein
MERVEHLALGHHGRRLELALEVIAIADPSTPSAAPTPASDASVNTRPG